MRVAASLAQPAALAGCLVAASAAQLALGHRGQQASWTIAWHLAATLAYGALAHGVVRGTFRPRAPAAFALAAVLAALALALSPQLSDDIWRYVFEGRVVCAGENPYLVPPDAPRLAHLRDASWELINNKGIPAAYPPAVQLALAAAVTLSPTPFGPKLVFAACAYLTFVALWSYLPRVGLPRERAVLFGWCPLVWLECAGEGHGESLAVLFTVLSLWASAAARPGLAGLCLGVATASKFLPCVLLPFVARRGGRAVLGFGAALALLYAPFVAPPAQLFAGTLEYAARWRANDSAFAVVHWLVEALLSPWRHGDGYTGWLMGVEVQRVAKWPLLVLGALVLLRAWRARASPERAAFVFFVFFVACSPTLHPWYVVLLVPWLCVFPSMLLLSFTGTVVLAYHVLPGWLGSRVWQEDPWVKVVEYLPFYAALLAPTPNAAPWESA